MENLYNYHCSVPEPDPPESYTSNNKKEQLLLQFSENFQRQFRQLYSDRKPLLLTPLNEYGVPVSEKTVCYSTTGVAKMSQF